MASRLAQQFTRLSVEEVVARDEAKKGLEITAHIPARPQHGSSGRAIQVAANMFEIKSFPDETLIHYDINITPDVPPKLNRSIFQALEAAYGASEFASVPIVYDGRNNFYTLKALPKASYLLRFEVPREGQEKAKDPKFARMFEVKIKQVADINLYQLNEFVQGKLNYTPYDAINAMDIIMHHGPANKLTPVGRSFYSPEGAEPISGAAELWKGVFQSVRAGQNKLYLNIDATATAFFQSCPITKFAGMLLHKRSPEDLARGLSDQERIRLDRTIRGLKIEVTHRGDQRRKYRVLGASRTPANKTMFTLESGEEMSVATYFERQYSMKLRFPGLPCLKVGSVAKSIMLPMEVCKMVEGQRQIKKLSEDQTADMIKMTATKPHVRQKKVEEGFNKLNEARAGVTNAFGIQVDARIAKVAARVLAPPQLHYGKGSRDAVFTPDMGAWNLRDKKCAAGATLSHWAVVSLTPPREDDDVKRFVTELVTVCKASGLTITNPRPSISYTRTGPGDIEQALLQAARSMTPPPQLIVVILTTTSSFIYGEVKRVTDTVLGIPSQCLQLKNVKKAQKQYCANVFLKINSKLGGTNLTLGKQLSFISAAPTVVFGADVTHPGAGDMNKPSIAAVVASMDMHLGQYSSITSAQERRQEIIQNLDVIARKLLIQFYRATGTKPQRILFYRDGVSDGQFAAVQVHELAALRVACENLEAGYKPTITFVVVQKRHRIRLFPLNRNESDRSGNIQPGTVVDREICHPREFDFYLCSHSGIQGTSRPTHYHVLHDENGFTADTLQDLTYKMCYTYARCTRSVSVVPPAYYAHLAAFRARLHVATEETSFSDSASNVSGVTGGTDAPIRFAAVHGALENKMYWI